MNTAEAEIKRREKVALDTIKKSLSVDDPGNAAMMFVEHHLSEIESSYWAAHFNTNKPEPGLVLDILMLQAHWAAEEKNGIDVFDFTLPGEVTQYVISVRFDEFGRVEEIDMES